MIYVIEGEEPIFVRNKVEQLSNQVDCDVIRFDGNDKNFSLFNVVDSCNTSSLFSNKNVVLVKDPPFLCKKIDEKDLEPITKYVSSPIFETDLIFYTYDNKFNSKLKAYKNVATNAEIIKYDCLDYKNFNTYASQEVRRANLNINNDAFSLLVQICKRSATLLKQNIDVLSNYLEKITIQAINKLCTSSDDNDSFELINAITAKDITKVVYLERRMLKDNDSIYSVIGLLAAQLRFLYRLSYLSNSGMRSSEIKDELNISDYRYSKSIEALQKLNMNQILNLLNELSILDIKCKSDASISDQSKFELFILNLLRKENYASN